MQLLIAQLISISVEFLLVIRLPRQYAVHVLVQREMDFSSSRLSSTSLGIAAPSPSFLRHEEALK